MKKVTVLMLVLAFLASMMMACGKKAADNETDIEISTEAESKELSEQQLKALAYINENGKNVLPLYKRYVYAGEVEVDDHICDRFEFYTDEMFLGAIAKVQDEDIMYWDPEHGKYMFMEYDNDGWYVTGRLVNEPTVENQENNNVVNLDDGISGQYTMDNSSFYITLYAPDYAGSADGYFRASGIVNDENGLAKQFSLAGEFYLKDEDGTLAYTVEDSSTEQTFKYSKTFVYQKNNEEIRFLFGDECVFVSDAGIHASEKYNLTGKYDLVVYY